MKKIISVVVSLAFIFSLCVPLGYAAKISAFPDDPFLSGFSEYVTIDGERAEIQYMQDSDGNNIVKCIHEDGTVDVAKYDKANNTFYWNGERISTVIVPLSAYASNIPLEGTLAGNWEMLGEPSIFNWETYNLTASALCSLMAAATAMPLSFLLDVIGYKLSKSDWVSAVQWQFVNFEDYGFKTGMYKHCQVFDGPNGTGNYIAHYNTSVTVR
ncbi:hypothetical protein N510_003156 [Firmicutes bacterium ASF500]|nr:hypothetical protein N510_003156 [Firmicutes bacterium ASF500]